MSYKLYVLFCLVALFNTIYSHPTPEFLGQSTDEDGNDGWKPNPPVTDAAKRHRRDTLAQRRGCVTDAAKRHRDVNAPGEPFIPNCVVSIDHGVYFNNCTREPSVITVMN